MSFPKYPKYKDSCVEWQLVAGTFQVPSAESPTTAEPSEGVGHGTWNVPATLENDE